MISYLSSESSESGSFSRFIVIPFDPVSMLVNPGTPEPQWPCEPCASPVCDYNHQIWPSPWIHRDVLDRRRETLCSDPRPHPLLRRCRCRDRGGQVNLPPLVDVFILITRSCVLGLRGVAVTARGTRCSCPTLCGGNLAL